MQLFRSVKDQKLAGVCGGIGEYFKIDSNLVRGFFILAFFLEQFWIIVYLVLAFLLPRGESGEGISFEKNRTMIEGGTLLGVGLILAGGYFLLRRILPGFDFKIIASIGMIGLGGYLIYKEGEKR